jgi:hypothetical protein
VANLLMLASELVLELVPILHQNLQHWQAQ